MKPRKAAVGRIVHYYEGDWEALAADYPGVMMTPAEMTQHGLAARGTNGTRVHPAIITHVHSDECVNLTVFFDAHAPRAVTSMCHLPDEVFAEGMHCTNSGWRGPERD